MCQFTGNFTKLGVHSFTYVPEYGQEYTNYGGICDGYLNEDVMVLQPAVHLLTKPRI